MLQRLLNEWSRLTEEISKVHDEPVFVSTDFLKEKLFPVIGVTTVVLTIIYTLCFKIVDKIAPTGSTDQARCRICYQITNVCFNIFIGCCGLYLEYKVLPTLDVDPNSPNDKIIGHENELYLVTALQLGYQAWAMPVGIIHVGETLEMIMHHTAVVVSCIMTGFLTISFRYYSPFFYGVMELSSIPLSIMNSFKDNPEWIKKYPKGYEISRAVFALSFLAIRNVMCASRWPIFLRDNFIVFYTKEWGFYKVFMFFQCGLAFFLAYLQLLWGSIVVRNILKMFTKKKGDSGNKKKA